MIEVKLSAFTVKWFIGVSAYIFGLDCKDSLLYLYKKHVMEFILRPWSLSDVQSLAKYANNKEIAKNLRDKFPHPYLEEDAENFIRFVQEHNPDGIMAIEINGEACGGIGIHPQEDIYRKNAEMGYWIGEAYWGKGIMTKAIKQMVMYGFQKFDINRIFAIPFHNNIGSQKALEKAGFKVEAKMSKTIFKNGEYLDEIIYAIRDSENLTK